MFVSLKKIFNKLFVGGNWYVGIRKHSHNSNMIYDIVEAPDSQWIADPFLYEFEGRHFLFVEQYFEKKHRAGIGVYEIENGISTHNKIIIENDYHMSYPCVFYYKGNHYIIPESSANNTIDLYIADSFPYKWSHMATLLSGEKYVDSTVYIDNERILLLSYKSEKHGWKLVVFNLNIEECRLTNLCEKAYLKNTGRPAGFLYHADKLYRPSQDCSNKYGEGLIINEVDKIEKGNYSEHRSTYISYKDVKSPIDIQRIHTLNRDSQYEVVDFFKEKIDIFHAFRIIKRAYL